MLHSGGYQFRVRCHGLLQRCARSCMNTSMYLKLAFLAFYASVLLQQRDGAPFPDRTPPPFNTSRVLSDLDDDGIADQAALSVAGLQQSIELHLSRTDEFSALPFSPATDESGSLLPQDVDNDGDTDLLWRGFRHPNEVLVWLNNGSGRFECLCPPEPQTRGLTPSISGFYVPDNRCPESAINPERSPSPWAVLTCGWDVSVTTNRLKHRLGQVWTPSCSQRRPTDRGPPLFLC